MPKKRVGVSLRRPSPAPDTVPESVAVVSEVVSSEGVARGDFARGDIARGDIARGDGVLDGAASTVSMSADMLTGGPAVGDRPSDIVALREAAPEPGRAEVKAIEAFVNGAATAFEKAASEIPPAQLAEVLRRGPAGYRELVVYLPEELARELSLHCLEHDLDMSRLIASAIERHLEPPSVPAPVAAPRIEDAPVSEGLLSLAARVLMGELTAWARAVWARRRASSVAATAS